MNGKGREEMFEINFEGKLSYVEVISTLYN